MRRQRGKIRTKKQGVAPKTPFFQRKEEGAGAVEISGDQLRSTFFVQPKRKDSPGGQSGQQPSAATPPAAVRPLIVDDRQPPEPGQLKKSEFLQRLQVQLCASVDAAFAGTPYSAQSCPFLGQLFAQHGHKPAARLLQLVHRFAPESAAAADASQVLRLIGGRAYFIARNWLETREISGLPPEIAGQVPETVRQTARTDGWMGQASSAVSKVSAALAGLFFKAKSGGARSARSARGIQATLGQGRGLASRTRSQMEHAFGANFSDVRIHINGPAADLNREMNARAFTLGRHIAFGADEYQPGTEVGQALIAHELAHVEQQRQGLGQSHTEEELERDADQSLLRQPVGQFGRPRLRTGLRLQRCSTESSRERVARLNRTRARITQLMGNVRENKDEIIRIIEGLKSSDAELLAKSGLFMQSSLIEDFARSAEGAAVMRAAVKKMREGDILAKVRADKLEKILNRIQKATPPKPTATLQKQLDRINKAINADPRKEQYQKAAIPLKLPVTLFSRDAARMGGVYYDPGMPKDTKKGGTAGGTKSSSLDYSRFGEKFPLTLIFIKLGPLALSFSDNYLRSTLWHEFLHYKTILEFRKEDKEQTEESRLLEEEHRKSSRDVPNQEVFVTSTQIKDDYKVLKNKELASLLRYLADNMASADIKATIRKEAIQRIVGAVGKKKRQRKRMRRLIRRLSRRRRRALRELSKALKKAR